MVNILYYFFILNEIGLYGLPAQIMLIILVVVLSLFLFFYIKNGKKTGDLYLSEEDQTTFLKSILDHSSTGNAIIDSDGVLRYVNFGFIALFDESETPLVGKSISDIPQLSKLTRCFEQKSSSVVEVSGKDDLSYMIKYFTVKDSDQNVVGRYLKMLPNLKNNDDSPNIDLSHELKTPLHAVLGFSHLLQKDSELSADQNKLLEKIVYHSKLLDDKIKSFLGGEHSQIKLMEQGKTKKSVKKILVVDDVSINRTLLKLMLKRYGLDVQEASNGEAALKILETWKADLILMDLSMPVMDGIETVKVIRGSGTNGLSASKIIAVTATQRYSRDELIASGFDDLMQKPFKEEDLLKRIGLENTKLN